MTVYFTRIITGVTSAENPGPGKMAQTTHTNGADFFVPDQTATTAPAAQSTTVQWKVPFREFIRPYIQPNSDDFAVLTDGQGITSSISARATRVKRCISPTSTDRQIKTARSLPSSY